MDVGQSPIQFIDQTGNSSKTNNSYYYGNSNMNNTSNQLPPTSSLGALSSRLHQLRPAGSVPFSSRTNPTQISSTLPRHKPNNTINDNDLCGYQTMPIGNKSISIQNLTSLNNQQFLHRDRSMMDGYGVQGNQTIERPRPASARDPGFTDLIDLPVSHQRRIYDSLYGPRLSQPNQQKMSSSRFKQQRSSSFDYERDLALVDPSRTLIPLPQPSAPNMFGPYEYHYPGANPMMDNLMIDYQTDVFTLQRELSKVQQEVELTKEKLASSLNSIKTFWSPELKRERTMRKDENSKYVLLAEELHQLQLEKKNMLSNIHQLETELRKEKELRSKHAQTAQEVDLLYRRCEELEKENRLLAKQSEEFEKRSLSHKESLVTADENIRKLLEVVKVAKSGNNSLQGIRLDRFEEDQNEIERLRSQIHDYSQKTIEIERTIVERDFEVSRNKERADMLNQEVQNLRQENEHIRQDIQQTQTLQSLVDTKESKILTLENEIRLLEDELGRLRDEELITPTTSVNGIDDYDKNMRTATVRPHERLMKSKLETMSCEISKRDSEIYSLQSRLEMAEKQHQDQNHHINVLKEQVKTREHKISMLLADVEDFRKRLKEKEILLEKKSQILTSSQTEKHQIDSEILDLKDQCEMKDKKISLLQRKVENLEDILNDKENQLTTAKSKLITLHSEHTTTEGTRAGLEECLRDRDRQLERLKETKTRMEHEFQDEIEMQKKSVSEIKSRLDNTERELREKINVINEMREELSELRAIKFKRESEVNNLQVQLSQKASEVTSLQLELQNIKKQYLNDTEFKTNHRIAEMESQLIHYSESTSRLQGEVDRLLNMMRGLESEKMDKDRQINQLESQLKDNQNVISNLKRSHQNERTYLNEDLESLKRKEDNLLVDMEVTKTTLSERENRIKELEQALRESVKITAERETYVISKEDLYKQLENKVSDQKQNLEQIQKERNNLSAQLASVQEDLRDKESHLKKMESECFQNYIPELERTRKSNQDLMLRVQALVKIVQGREFHLSEHERISLTELGIYPDSIAHRGYPSTGRISAGPYSSGYNYNSKVTWSMGSYPISHSSTLIGGSVPHINSPVGGTGMLGMHGSSAFHSTIAQADEMTKLGRLLHEKEQMLHHQMEEISRLRFQNIELESKLKALEERITSSSYFTSKLGGMGELSTLRQTNTELTSKVSYMKSLLDEREEKIKSISMDNRSNFLQMEIEKIKREMGQTISEKDSHISVLSSDIDKLKLEKADINNNYVIMQQDIKEKHDKIRIMETDQAKLNMDKDSLQKKYQTALNHLQEKTEKIENLERECYQKQMDEIKRLKAENEENSHRLTFFQKSLSDRDVRIEQLEKEHYKLRDDITAIQKQNHNSESEVKRLKDELGYREQRLKQIQNTHTEELNQVRQASQENNSRLSQLRITVEEKDQTIKSKSIEIEKWKSDLETNKRRLRDKEAEIARYTNDLSERDAKLKTLEREYNDEIQRFQKANEETTSRINLMQKRIDEREARLRKIEQENNELLDEIHNLRKRNHETESNLDILRQQIMDKDIVLAPASRSNSAMDMGFYNQQVPNVSNSMGEIEKIRRQYQETLNANNQLQRVADESSLQCDRLTLDRDYLNQQLQDLQEKHELLKRSLLVKESELSTKNIELSTKKSDEYNKLNWENQELKVENRNILQELENKDIQVVEISREIENLQMQLMDSEKSIQSRNIQVSELQNYVDQLIRERDDARLIASSNSGMSNSNYRMQSQEKERQLQQQVDKFHFEMDKIQRENKEQRNRIQELSRQLQETQKNLDAVAKERDCLREQVQGKSKESQIIQLSKEMERLHRTEEISNQQLKEAQKNYQDSQNQLINVKQEYQKKLEFYQMERDRALKELEELNSVLREHQEQTERREEEISNSQQDESEKIKHQCSSLSKKLITLQHEYETKERQIQQLTETLEQSRKDNREFQRIIDELQSHVQQLEYDLENVNRQLDGASHEVQEQECLIQELSQKLESCQYNKPYPQDQNLNNQYQTQEVNRSDYEKIREELSNTKKMLQEKDQRVRLLETECFQQQADEIERLRKELKVVSNQESRKSSLGQQSMSPSYSNNDIQSLKMEVDSLKREVNTKNDQLEKYERECQEKHLRRIDALQLKLKRYEEDLQQFEKQTDELKKTLEDREKRLKQVKMSQHQATSVELEKLREEFNHSQDEVNTKTNQIKSLEKQINGQIKEILEIKQEALTASICEKDANIALLQMTGANNSHAQQAMQKLMNEKSQMQSQLKQLSATRQKLQEEQRK